jgi:hypothetical protein
MFIYIKNSDSNKTNSKIVKLYIDRERKAGIRKRQKATQFRVKPLSYEKEKAKALKRILWLKEKSLKDKISQV